MDELASRVRSEVNTTVYTQMAARMDAADAAALDGLLDVDPVLRRSGFDRCKTVAPAVTVTRFREHVAHLTWLDSLGDTAAWVAGVPPAKIAHFAGEARLTDAAGLGKYGTHKRRALMASLLHTARVRARDEIVTMFCKRMASIHKRPRERLAELREAHRGESERLLDAFAEVLAGVREALGASDAELAEGVADPPEEVFARAGRLVLGALSAAGGVAELSAAHEAVSAHHSNNHLPLVERFYRSSRAAMFDVLDVVVLHPTSAERAVLDAVRTTSRHAPDFFARLADGTAR